MKTTYYAKIVDYIIDAVLVDELECEIEYGAWIAGGAVEIDISDVFIDGKSLTQGSTVSTILYGYIEAAATREFRDGGAFFDRVCEDNGFVYHGAGGNDPEGCWK